MAVSERGFAGQLQLTDGRVFDYDDPGCLLAALQAHREQPVHAVWVHHHREERWLPRERAGFLRVSPTPMGFGFGAVDATEPDALSWDQVAGELRARTGHGGDR